MLTEASDPSQAKEILLNADLNLEKKIAQGAQDGSKQKVDASGQPEIPQDILAEAARQAQTTTSRGTNTRKAES